MPKTHALLAPSSAERWLSCTPSARFEEKFEEKKSSYADEGTLAHNLGELLIKWKLKLINKSRFRLLLSDIETSEYYNESMFDYCDEYATYVVEKYHEVLVHTPDAKIFIEYNINLTDYIPESYGTGDVVIVGDGWLILIDLKYGKGIPVSCVENKQMMLYGLGTLKEFDFVYNLDAVSLTIYQPRLENISTWSIPAEELVAWGENVLIPTAKKAFIGEGDFVPGKHCTFCKAKAKCRKFSEYNLELAALDFRNPTELTDAEIAEVLSRANLFEVWINAVQEYAMSEAVNHEKQWPGFKVVEGRSNRKYVDEEKIIDQLTKAGFTEDDIYKPRKLKGITEMTNEIGNKDFEKYVSKYTIKPRGKPALVPESDKRPAISSAESAKQDFQTE